MGCKHDFTRLRFKDGSERQALHGDGDMWWLSAAGGSAEARALLSARCDDCGEQLSLGYSDEAPVAVEVRAAAMSLSVEEDPELIDYKLMDWIGWDSHADRVDDEVTDRSAAGWLARELATHDDRETRDADAWPWDVTRPLAEQWPNVSVTESELPPSFRGTP